MVCAFLWLGGFPQCSAALDPGRSISQYVHAQWGADRGFLGGTIYAMAQSADGFLWIGTDHGLVRFNGYSFELIQRPIPGLPPIGRVRGLKLDADGNLWIRLEGANMLIYRDGRFDDAFARLGVPMNTYTAMALDGSRKVVVSGLGGMALRVGSGHVEALADSQQTPGTVISIAGTLDGRLWMGTRDNGLFLVQPGRGVEQVKAFRYTKINALAADKSIGLWIGTDHGIRFLTREGAVRDNLPAWTHSLQVLTIVPDREGNLWVGTDRGLMRISADGQAVLRSEATWQSHPVTAVFEDKEGSLWFGGEAGLERLQDGVFTTYGPREGLPVEPMGPIYASQLGEVWFAPLSGGIYRMKDHRVEPIKVDGLDHDIIYSIHGDGDTIWIGRQHGGLTAIRVHGSELTARTYTAANGLAQGSIYAVHRARGGALWAGTVSAGVSVLRDGHFQSFTAADGLSSNAINSIAEGPDDTIYLATPRGLDAFLENRWQHWTEQNGLPPGELRTCFADAEGVLWIAASGGLAKLDRGRMSIVRELPMVLREPISGITEDQLDYLWLLTTDHLVRVNRRALLAGALHAGDIETFDGAGGLSGAHEVRRERLLVSSSSGELWVAAGNGIARAEPRLTLRDSVPLHVRLESIISGADRLSPEGAVSIHPGSGSLTFQFVSDSLFAPDQVRFRYKLDNADAEWSEPVDLRQVSYNNLGPGTYRFRVVASRDGSMWNNPESSVTVTLERAFWQTWWFRTAIALVAVLLILFVGHLRRVRLARQLQIGFQERLAERTRIAQELHDTLLQSFQGLMLRFQTVDNMLPGRASDAKRVLEDALDRADGALLESREAIQNLRSLSAISSNLAQAINGLMEEALEQGDGFTERPGYSVVVEGTPRKLNPWVNSEIQRIAGESIRNSLQHARARHVEAEITYGDTRLRLRLRDDGVGIDPAVLQTGNRVGHWGLIGMRERARSIGARFEMWSRPGAGTELELDVPARVAYEEFRATPELPFFRKRPKQEHNRAS